MTRLLTKEINHLRLNVKPFHIKMESHNRWLRGVIDQSEPRIQSCVMKRSSDITMQTEYRVPAEVTSPCRLNTGLLSPSGTQIPGCDA